MSSKTRQAERDLLESDDNSNSSKMSSKQKSNVNKKKTRRQTVLSDSSDSDSDYSTKKSTKNTRRTSNAKSTKKTDKNKLDVPRCASRTSRSTRGGNNLTRADSNSSSEKEFMKNKIIDSHLETINEYTKSNFDNSNDCDDADKFLSKNDAFHFKNYLQKCFQQFKNISTKLINDVEHTKKIYYKENIKFSDTTMAIIECKNIIRDLRDAANDCEKQLVARYNNWCKTTKNKNLLINDDQPKDTPKRWESTQRKEVIVASSANEESDLDTPTNALTKNSLVNGHVDDAEKKRIGSTNSKEKCDSPEETEMLTPPIQDNEEEEEEKDEDEAENHVKSTNNPVDLDVSGDLFADEEDSEKAAKQALLISSPDSSEENGKSPASESGSVGSLGKKKKESDVLLVSSESDDDSSRTKRKAKEVKKKSSRKSSSESSDKSSVKLRSKKSVKKVSKGSSSESDVDILEEKSKSKTSRKNSSAESDEEIMQEKLTSKKLSKKGSKDSTSESDADILEEKSKSKKLSKKNSSGESDDEILQEKLTSKTLSKKGSKDSSSESDADISEEKSKSKKLSKKNSSGESDEEILQEKLTSKPLAKKSSKDSSSESDADILEEKSKSKTLSKKNSSGESEEEIIQEKLTSKTLSKKGSKDSSSKSDSDISEKESESKKLSKKNSSEESDEEILQEKSTSKSLSKKGSKDSSSESDADILEEKSKSKTLSKKNSSGESDEEILQEKSKSKTLSKKGSKDSSSESDADILEKKSESKKLSKENSSAESDEEIIQEKLTSESLSKKGSKDSSSESDADILEKKSKSKTLSRKNSKNSSDEENLQEKSSRKNMSKKASKDSSSDSDIETLEGKLTSSKKASKDSSSESDAENLKDKVSGKKLEKRSSDQSDSDEKNSKTKEHKKSPSSRKSSSDLTDLDAKNSKEKSKNNKSSSDSSDSETETLKKKTNGDESPISLSSDSDDKSFKSKKKIKKSSDSDDKRSKGKKRGDKSSSIEPEEIIEKEAKEKLLASSSDSDEKKSDEKEMGKDLLDSSSDSDQKKSESKKITEKRASDSVESDQNDLSEEERAKARLLKSSSDSERDDVGQDKINNVEETPDNEGEVEENSETIHRSNSESPNAYNSPATKNTDESEEDNEKEEPKKSTETKNNDEELTESPKSTESSKKNSNDKKPSPKNRKNKKSKEIIDNVNSDSDSDDDSEKSAKRKLLSSSSEMDDDVNDSKENSIKSVNKKRNNNDNSGSNSESNGSNSNISKGKKNKLILSKNKYYKADKKLRMKCTVEIKRLRTNVLVKYSRAIQLSKDYLESKQVLSLLSLDNLEKRKTKRGRAHTSSEDEDSSRSKSKKKTKNTTEEETLLDHLKKVEAGDKEALVNSDISDTDSPPKQVEKQKELDIVEAHDNAIKAALLESSGSETEMAPHNDPTETTNEKDDKKDKKKSKDKKSKNDKEKENKDDKEDPEIVELDDDNEDDNDNDDDKKKKDSRKSSWKKSKILSTKFSSTDSEEENEKIQKRLSQRSNKKSDSDTDKEPNSSPIKKKKPRTRRRIIGSDDDSDIKFTDDSSEPESDDEKDFKNKKKEDEKKSAKRRRKSDSDSDSDSVKEEKKKPKRRRIRAVSDDSDDSDEEGRHNSQTSGKGSGRKNIRKVMKDKAVAEDTLAAAKQEEERLRRMAERQKIYNEMYETRLANEEKVDKLILDFDEETKEPLLSVDENLVKRLKPHQAKGIKFMWDACFESLEQVKTTKGSGCILAHCMGLGKSFQVVTLAHTLLTHNDKTGINTVMIVAPLSTVLNWMNEFKTWLSEVENGDDIELYEMTKAKTTLERRCQLENWQRTGGVLIIGYEMFRNLCAIKGKVRKAVQEAILKCILDPGPDLIVCDEGHLLKREDSAISKAMRRIRTLRRVVLTGTPLQNNLLEYHCMVQFVKPNLLGTKKEFSNRFVNPIQNGQFDDSTEYDVKIMKKRAHVLHKMLEGSVQRFDYSVLTPFLPPKQEYVILVNLTEVQCQMYQYYLDNLSRRQVRVGGSLFADFQGLYRIWTHPYVMKLHAENSEKIREKKREAESESEGSLRDFIDDDSESESSSSERSGSNSDGSDVVAVKDDDKKTVKRSTRANPVDEEPPPEEEPPPPDQREWWAAYVNPEHYDDLCASSKLRILFDILKEAEQIGDKVLVFSQSLYSLSLIEKFLGMIDDETQNGNELETLDKHTGSWSLGLDYFRFDGQTSAENRTAWVKSFNKPSNTRARLFLISTRAGGLGINLTAANRVVIFDASWNPSHDVQSIFRIYRFGQKKPCYVYRLLAAGTMEEKIYNRQVTKLSLSCRVVDEQQIERHYGSHDLAELYQLELPKKDPPTLALPKDRLLAEIFLRHKTLVDNYHEHDSLLENIAEEELDEEERKQAWAEYEDEKAGKRMVQPMMGMNMGMGMNMTMNAQMLLYQNQMMNAVNLNNPVQQGELGKLLEMIKKDYPNVSEASQKEMAFRALNNMYNYVENRFTANNMPSNVSTMNIPNVPTMNVTPAMNTAAPTATLANMLAQQEYSRAHGQFNQMQRQLQYAQHYGNNVGHHQSKPGRPPKNTQNNYIARFASTEDEVMEIPTSSRGNTTQGNSGKRQEE